MHKKIYFWLALSWTFVIAVLCLASFGNMPKVSVANADKYVHFTFHFVFTGLWFLYLNHGKNESNASKNILIVLMLSFFYGIGIEIVQGLATVSRQADVFDVVANLAGAVAAVVLLKLYLANSQKRKHLN